MDKRKRLTVTFGEYDDDVYEYLKSNKNASALVRHLVRGYMSGNPVIAVERVKNDEVVVTKSIEAEVEKEPTKTGELDLEVAQKLAVDFSL